MCVKEQIKKLIDEGKHAKEVNYSSSTSGFPASIEGHEYDVWMNNIKIFTENYCKKYCLYEEIIMTYDNRANSFGMTTYDDMMGYLESMLNDKNFIGNHDKVVRDKKQDKEKMLFISHSSIDLEYVKAFVELVEFIGIKSKENLFCSSLSGYKIPANENIYDYIKNQFDNKDLHVVMLLSDNYYNSVPCLNEMGATWITDKLPTVILLPNFTYSQIEGAIDVSKIHFTMEEKDRLNEFKNKLIEEFDLSPLDNDRWETKRDEFVKKIHALEEVDKYKKAPQKVEIEEIEEDEDNENLNFYFRFINKRNESIRCKKIDGEITDKNNNKIAFKICGSKLKDIKVYNKENKRIVISVPKKEIKGIENFDIYELKSSSTHSCWGSIQ